MRRLIAVRGAVFARRRAGSHSTLGTAVADLGIVVVVIERGALAVVVSGARLARVLLLKANLLVGIRRDDDGPGKGEVDAEALSVAVGTHAVKQGIEVGIPVDSQDVVKGDFAKEVAVAFRMAFGCVVGRRVCVGLGVGEIAGQLPMNLGRRGSVARKWGKGECQVLSGEVEADIGGGSRLVVSTDVGLGASLGKEILEGQLKRVLVRKSHAVETAV